MGFAKDKYSLPGDYVCINVQPSFGSRNQLFVLIQIACQSLTVLIDQQHRFD